MKYVVAVLYCAILKHCYSSKESNDVTIGGKKPKREQESSVKKSFEPKMVSQTSPDIKKYDNYTYNKSFSYSNSALLSYNDWASYQAWNKKLATVRSENSISFPEILNKSLKAVLGEMKKSKDIKRLLVKYYFTDDENTSIWPKAILETETNLNLKFSREELFNMEKDIKAVYRRMLECDFLFSPFTTKKSSKKKNRERRKLKTKCYLTLHEYIDSGFTDFAFPRGTIEGEAKMLQMGLAYHMMSLLVLQMTQQMAIIAHVTPIKAAISIIDIAESLVESIKSFTKNTIDGRIQAISQIEICQMEVLLWKEFPVTCEIRMKRDVNSVDGIGGNKNIFLKRYRAKVIDNVTDKEVCNMALDTSETKDKDQVIYELTKACGLVRDNYARRIKKDITDFYTQRTLPVVKELSKLWYNDKKKLSEIKDKLQIKYHSNNY